MSKHSRPRFLLVLLFAAIAAAALVSADIGALAQNDNGNTSGGQSAENSNGNMMGATRRGRRGRRGRRARRNRAATAAAVAAAEGGAAIDPNGGAAQSGDVSGEQTDLSGTYTGHMTMTGGHEMSGEATLTITGNTFTLTGEGMNHNGRVYAVTTRGYTGASFYFSDMTDPSTRTPVVATVRARKRGDSGLWLSPVPGTQTRMTFGTGGGGGGGRRGRRGRRSDMTMTAPSPDATGDASATGDAAASGDATTTTTPRRRRTRRGRRGTTNTNTNTNSNSNTGDNSNTTPPM